MTVKLEVGKFYRTVANSKVECVAIWSKPDAGGHQATCITAHNNGRKYFLDGRAYKEKSGIDDIMREWVEPKKRVLMAPATLIDHTGKPRITSALYSSEEEAKVLLSQYGGIFIKWLIDTPYAIEVEYDG